MRSVSITALLVTIVVLSQLGCERRIFYGYPDRWDFRGAAWDLQVGMVRDWGEKDRTDSVTYWLTLKSRPDKGSDTTWIRLTSLLVHRADTSGAPLEQLPITFVHASNGPELDWFGEVRLARPEPKAVLVKACFRSSIESDAHDLPCRAFVLRYREGHQSFWDVMAGP